MSTRIKWPGLFMAGVLLALTACGAVPTAVQTDVQPTSTAAPLSPTTAPTPTQAVASATVAPSTAAVTTAAPTTAAPTATATPQISQQKVDVGGYKLNITCQGQGSPAVIFDSGYNTGAGQWSSIQPEVAKFTQACSYDRAGLGASEAGPKPRTSQQMVKELKTLLDKAGIKPPYLLVGHSFGGLNMQLYASQYPQDVSGVMLVEAASKDLMARSEPVLTRAGLEKFYNVAGNREGAVQQDFFDSFSQVQKAINFPPVPLLVITRGNPDTRAPAGWSAELGQPWEAVEKIWKDTQAELVKLSPQGRQVIAAKSGHQVPAQEPELVATSIRKLHASLVSGAAASIRSRLDGFLSNLPSNFYAVEKIDELKVLLVKPETVLVDVRTAAEYKNGHLPGAINIPLRTITANLDKLPQDRLIVLYCTIGYRAGQALTILHFLRYTNVMSYSPSYAGWTAAGEPLSRDEVTPKSGTMPRVDADSLAAATKFLTTMPENNYSPGGSFSTTDQLVVDLREPAQVAVGPAKNSQNIPLARLGKNWDVLPREQPLFVYGNTPHKTAMGLVSLHLAGFTKTQALLN